MHARLRTALRAPRSTGSTDGCIAPTSRTAARSRSAMRSTARCGWWSTPSGERTAYEHRADPAEPKVLRAANAHCEPAVEFDRNGFPARLVQRVDGLEWTIRYERDEIGRVGACLYPQAADLLRTTSRETRNGVTKSFRAGVQSYFDVAMHTDGMSIAFADGTSS